ncbi:MAG TPA: helix-turn-helix domain-containing protein [Gemmatimonadales bacterium]
MNVVAVLSDHLLSTLRAVLRNDHRVLTPPPSALVAGLRELEADVVVLEPSVIPPAEWGDLVEGIRALGTSTVVVYTTLAPPAMRATVELARLGVRHIVLKGYDDSPRHFRSLFDALATELWRSQLYERLLPRLVVLPVPIQEGVAFLFRAPHRVRDVADLAATAGVTTRTLHRRLAAVGIPSAKRLVLSARLEWGLTLLRNGHAQIRDVAARLAYPSPRRFRREAQLLTGLPPSRLRTSVSAEELLERLHEAVVGTESVSRDGIGGA